MANDRVPEELSRVLNHRLVPRPGSYTVDPVHTFVGFRAQHLIVGRVRGRFDGVSGVAVIGKDPLASTLEVQVDTASVTTLMPIRDDDLRSEHYLDAARYPKMTYRSSGVSELSSGDWSVAGELTVRDKTRPVELVVHFGGSVADQFGNERVAFHATGTIGRKEFGLTHELEKESGGLTIARDIAIDIDAELIAPR